MLSVRARPSPHGNSKLTDLLNGVREHGELRRA